MVDLRSVIREEGRRFPSVRWRGRSWEEEASAVEDGALAVEDRALAVEEESLVVEGEFSFLHFIFELMGVLIFFIFYGHHHYRTSFDFASTMNCESKRKMIEPLTFLKCLEKSE